MPEIWVPYGEVDVSFDLKQENLAQIVEPNPTKISKEEMEARAGAVRAETLFLLSTTPGSVRILDLLLGKNKAIRKLLHLKGNQSIARRKAQEFNVEAELFDSENLEDASMVVEGSPLRIFKRLRYDRSMVALTSIHYDPLFGLSSAASDLVSLNEGLKHRAYRISIDDLPCPIDKSAASLYSTRLLQTRPSVDVIHVIEKARSGVLDFYYGDPESVHAQSIDYWRKNLLVPIQSRSERIIFGAGGSDNDGTLSEALSRSFFNIVLNATLDDKSKVCILSECSQGLGGQALVRYVTGNLTPWAKLDESTRYFDGLEVLTAFYRANKNFDLWMLSTLPKYYMSKFDFKPVKGAREVPQSILPHGSRAKILVVPDASTCYFPPSG